MPRRPGPRRALAALGAACAAVGVGACGAGAGAAPASPGLVVSRDFGADTLLRTAHPKVSGEDTVLRLLRRNARITTRFGGGFVQSIDGVAGGTRDGRPVDWFLYVDGVLSDRGAADVRVGDDAEIWWDHHEWETSSGPAAVVGSFPAPFARAPARLACVPAGQAACTDVRRALEGAGAAVDDVAPSAVAEGPGPGLVVGTWAAVRRVPGARVLATGPGASGVYARPSAAGDGLRLLDARGHTARTLRSGAGLVAATHAAGGPAVWTVTGTDDAGVRAAAGALTESRLRGRFAVATTDRGDVALPVRGGPG